MGVGVDFKKVFGNLHSVFLLKFQVLLPESVDTIDHGLDELNLRVAQTMLVGNVIGVTWNKKKLQCSVYLAIVYFIVATVLHFCLMNR